MRWLILILLVVNAAYFVHAGLHFAHTGKNVAAPAGVDAVMPGAKLVLVREAVPVSDFGGEVGLVDKGRSDKAMCTLLGPFVRGEDGAAMASRLQAVDVRARLASLQVEGMVDYWVYLKAEMTREQALRRVRELQEKRIDGFVIPQGELVNGISLGIFDNRDQAERHRRDVSEEGYAAEIKENPRKYEEYWLVIDALDSARIGPELQVELDIAKNHLELRKDSCLKVASYADFK